MAKLDFPSSPSAGDTYAAPNGVTYTWDPNIGIGVWTAQVTDPVVVINPGAISGTAQVGQTLVYSAGEAAGGVAPYSYSWEWIQSSDLTPLQLGGNTLVIPATAAGTTVYVSFTVTDSAGSSATGVTSVYPVGSAISYAPFPSSTFGPISSPNASPSTVNIPGEGLYGEVSTTWADGSRTLVMTGDTLFQVNGGGYSASSKAVVNGDTVDIIWDTAKVAAAADGATLSGSLSDGVNENLFSMTVDRSPFGLAFGDLTSQAVSTIVVSDVVTPSDYNVPVTITVSGTATPLTSLGVSVAGGSYSSSSQTVSPGQTVQVRGTTGSSQSTSYGATVSMGSPASTDTWTVGTSAATPAIATPSIVSPPNGSINLNPNVNAPAGIPLAGTTYSPLNGAGATQTGSTWEVYSGILGQPETSQITYVSTSDGTLWQDAGVVSNGYGAQTNPQNAFDGNTGTFAPSPVNNGNIQINGQLVKDTWDGVRVYVATASREWYGSSSQVPGSPGWVNMESWKGAGSATYGVSFSTYPSASPGYPGISAIEVDGVVLTGAQQSTLLEFQDATDLAYFEVGDYVEEVTGDAYGTVLSKDSATVPPSLVISPSFGTWSVGLTVRNLSASPVPPGLPTSDPPNPSRYAAVSGSPFAVATAPFTTKNLPLSSLATDTTYFARVLYQTTNSAVATSDYSDWVSFSTASDFTVSPGTQMLGGFYAGQINISGTIYNLIVAPKEGTSSGPVVGGALKGQVSQGWKTSSTADTPAATAQNTVYGGDASVTFSDGSHPIFDWLKSATGPNAGIFDITGASNGSGIGGYNDWYIPAPYEQNIIYRNLKPTADQNDNTTGSNPYAVPAASNYTLTSPGQTSATLFQSGGEQAYASAAYWTSAENPGATTEALKTSFAAGWSGTSGKASSDPARAIRRQAA